MSDNYSGSSGRKRIISLVNSPLGAYWADKVLNCFGDGWLYILVCKLISKLLPKRCFRVISSLYFLNNNNLYTPLLTSDKENESLFCCDMELYMDWIEGKDIIVNNYVKLVTFIGWLYKETDVEAALTRTKLFYPAAYLTPLSCQDVQERLNSFNFLYSWHNDATKFIPAPAIHPFIFNVQSYNLTPTRLRELFDKFK